MSSIHRHRLLNEMLHLRAVLRENRQATLRASLLPRLVTQIASGTLDLSADLRARLGIAAMPHGPQARAWPQQAAETLFAHLLSLDPDPAKANSQWLLTHLLQRSDSSAGLSLADLDRARETLAGFLVARRDGILADADAHLSRYGSLNDLAAALRRAEAAHARQRQHEQIARTARKVLRFPHGGLWVQIDLPASDAAHLELYDNAAATHRVLSLTIGDAGAVFVGEPADLALPWGHYLTELLLHRPDAVRWHRKSRVRTCDLTAIDAERLAAAKIGFADIATAYALHGQSEATERVVTAWCHDHAIGQTGTWIDDALLVRRFASLAEIAAYAGDAALAEDAERVRSGRGLHDWEIATKVDADEITGLIKTLDKPLVRRLGDWLHAKHKEDAAALKGRFNFDEPADIARLCLAADDQSLLAAARYALQHGRRVGGEAHLSKAVFKALDACPWVRFADDQGGWTGKARANAEAVYAVPLKAIVDFVAGFDDDRRAAEALAGSSWPQALADRQPPLGAHRPAKGWKGDDAGAAAARFRGLVTALLPPEAARKKTRRTAG